MLAHGFASPRRRGFALIGNQCCTDSAATIAHDENAGKSEVAEFAAFPSAPSRGLDPERSDGDDFPIVGILPATLLYRRTPVGILSKCQFFLK